MMESQRQAMETIDLESRLRALNLGPSSTTSSRRVVDEPEPREAYC